MEQVKKRHRRTKAEMEAARAAGEVKASAARSQVREALPACNLGQIVLARITELSAGTDQEIAALHKKADANKARDEQLAALRGAKKTYDAMKNILGHGYSTSKVLEVVENTRRQTMTDICTLMCRLNGNSRKSTEDKEKLSIAVGTYKAIQKVKLILDDAFIVK